MVRAVVVCVVGKIGTCCCFCCFRCARAAAFLMRMKKTRMKRMISARAATTPKHRHQRPRSRLMTTSTDPFFASRRRRIRLASRTQNYTHFVPRLPHTSSSSSSWWSCIASPRLPCARIGGWMDDVSSSPPTDRPTACVRVSTPQRRRQRQRR
jgi:hypothetical protein